MGNQVCMGSKSEESEEKSKKNSMNNKRSSSRREKKFNRHDDIVDEQQAAIAFLVENNGNGNGNGNGNANIQFARYRSKSQKGLPPHSLSSSIDNNSVKQSLPRSASARPRSMRDRDSPLNSVSFLDKDGKLPSDLETNHFVLVHGGGFGAWCWYKTLALLQEVGCQVDAIDLTGSGRDPTDPNTITTLDHYVKPLMDLIRNLSEDKKVILVAHDFGGACISYVMESFPSKVSKAVFISATMVTDGQRAYDILAQEASNPDSLLQKAQKFIYSNGNTNPPTAIELDKDLLADVIFNHSPSKDVALASVSLKSIPFVPFLERISLSEGNFGSVRRFFIATTDDLAFTEAVQENMLKSNPPEKVFRIKGSDHCPFFSKPQALHKLLVEIAQIPR